MEHHPHAHLLVTAGGLSPDGPAWVKPAHPRFLLPGYMLSSVFRAKMHGAFKREGLTRKIDPKVWNRRWTVHVEAIGSGQHAALYLSRYIYRVAITNHRIERFQNGRVTFRYTHARPGETRRLTLPVSVFIARFLQHVFPRSFTKVRAYGLLSPTRRPDLERARALL
ncbi:MAG: IS91 family transposase [Gemmatimonadota bacterium]